MKGGNNMRDLISVTAKLLGMMLVLLVAIWVIIFAMNAFGLANYRVWGTQYENARRTVYENSTSYVQGKNQHLSRLYLEWQMSHPDHRDALCSTARYEASTIKPSQLHPSVKQWECVTP